MWNKQFQETLMAKRKKAKAAGGAVRVEKQHAQGKLTARERLLLLFDPESFVEVNDMMQSNAGLATLAAEEIPGTGVVTGYGKINGRLAFAASQDFTVHGGSLSLCQAKRICRTMDMAMEMRAPFISINDSGGARIEEGIDALHGYAEIFRRNVAASGVIPQISAIMGPCAGGACYSPAISDFIFIVRKTGLMFITGPQVVKSVTHEEVSASVLGGADVHMSKSGVAHFAYDTDEECLKGIRGLLSYLPQNVEETVPLVKGVAVDLTKGLEEVVTDNPRKCYDVRAVIQAIADRHSFLEVQEDFARNAVVGFLRIEGRTVGVVANQPNYLGGSLDCDGSDKMARFIRCCDNFNIPILTFVDVPAFLPGTQQEHSGIIRHGAKLLYAYAEATVPKVTVILRKAYGGAYIAMCSRGLGADRVFAFPIAEIAVMGAEGAIRITGRRQIEAAQNPEAEVARLTAEYEKAFLNPYIAAARGYVDEVILPTEMKEKVVSAFEMLQSKRRTLTAKKHGNIPL